MAINESQLALLKIQMKRALTSDWNRKTDTGSAWEGYLLRQGEFGVEIFADNSVKVKIGDGTTVWKDLPYISGDTGYFLTKLPAVSEAAVDTFYVVGEDIYYTKDNNTWIRIGGEKDFEKLINRPKYNNVTMTHNTNIPKVPTLAKELKYTPKSGTGVISTNVQGALDELSTKLKNTIQPANQPNILYGTNAAGAVEYYKFSDSKVNGSIAKRTSYGSLKTAEPIENDDAATKKYVDDITTPLNNSVTTITNTLNNTITRVQNLEIDNSDIKSKINTMNTNINNINSKVSQNTADISTLKTKTDTMQTSIDKNKNDIKALDIKVSDFDSRIKKNAQDIKDELQVRFDNDIRDIAVTGANNNNIILTKNDGSTIATSIPIVSNTNNGLMTKEAYKKIQDNAQDIEDLKNQGGRYIGTSFATKAQLDNYTIPSTVNVGDFTYVIDDEEHDGATTRYICTMNGSTKEFSFAYVIEYDPIGIANTTTKGIVLSSTQTGKIFVETDGTMSLNGYDGIITQLGSKVDKVAGKGLSTNDFTNAYKNKVDILTDTGNGSTFLSDDGTYKTIVIPEQGIKDIKVDNATIVDSNMEVSLHKVAVTGNYNDLLNLPQNLVQDANYVHTDNNLTDMLKSKIDLISTFGSGTAALMDDATYKTLANIAFSGSWNDLNDIPSNVVQDSNYVHTDNNFTNNYKNKLDNLNIDGEENSIETISLNGNLLAIDTDKNVDIDLSDYALQTSIPTKTSDLTNDSNFVSDANYVHTDNNFTTTLKTKLNGIESGAQVNKIEIVKVNNTALAIGADKSVNIDLSKYVLTSDYNDDMQSITTDIQALKVSGLWRGIFDNKASVPTNAKTQASSFVGGNIFQNDYIIVKEDETHKDAQGKPMKTRYYATAIAADGTITWTYFDEEKGSIAIATNTSLGLVKGVAYNPTTKDGFGKVSVDSKGEMTVNGLDTLDYIPLAGTRSVAGSSTSNPNSTSGPVTGPIWFYNNKGGIYGMCGVNDTFAIRGRSTATDVGYLEIATGDNGAEPIYVRQYKKDGGEDGFNKDIVRTLTLLNDSGNTTLPGFITIDNAKIYKVQIGGSIDTTNDYNDFVYINNRKTSDNSLLTNITLHSDGVVNLDQGKKLALGRKYDSSNNPIKSKYNSVMQWNQDEECVEFVFD